MLTLLRVIADGEKKHKRGLYLCECGLETVALIGNVKRGHTKSCGCLSAKMTGDRSRTHGHRAKRSKTYVAWVNMKSRCDNKNSQNWVNYGGRGISYDSRWEDFENFLDDMGESPPKLTLERRDNDADYSQDNCYWATRGEQGLNKRNNVKYELNGKSQTLSEWSRETGIGRVTMLKRIQRGVPLELALTVKGYLNMSAYTPDGTG
jgi:hypothetical protein